MRLVSVHRGEYGSEWATICSTNPENRGAFVGDATQLGAAVGDGIRVCGRACRKSTWWNSRSYTGRFVSSAGLKKSCGERLRM